MSLYMNFNNKSGNNILFVRCQQNVDFFLSFDYDSVKDFFICGYAPVFTNGVFYIVGGYVDERNSNTIARLDAITWSWSSVGRLQTSRNGHGAIWLNLNLIVVGGWEIMPTEFCKFENNEFTCTEQKSNLHDYGYFPLLFTVSDDYKNC